MKDQLVHGQLDNIILDIYDDEKISPLTKDAFQFIAGNRKARRSCEALSIQFIRKGSKTNKEWNMKFEVEMFTPRKSKQGETSTTLLHQLVGKLIQMIEQRYSNIC